ncbi:MAG: hypothetical protein P8Y69_15645 [Gammaproteobacteria bacterium]
MTLPASNTVAGWASSFSTQAAILSLGQAISTADVVGGTACTRASAIPRSRA